MSTTSLPCHLSTSLGFIRGLKFELIVENNNMDDKQKAGHDKDNSSLKPDPETLHTTDPQEHMEGPVSSVMQGIKNEAEGKGAEKGNGDKEKDEAE
jgi:hypothetical protein